MKFSNMKNKAILVTVAITSMVAAPSYASEEKRLECGKKIGVTLAYCLFKDDKLTFFDYIEQWRKIVKEYQQYFDQAVIASVMKSLDSLENYIKALHTQGKLVNPTKVATALAQLVENLPADVKKQFRVTFEQLQLQLLKRNKLLSSYELVGPLSKRLNKPN